MPISTKCWNRSFVVQGQKSGLGYQKIVPKKQRNSFHSLPLSRCLSLDIILINILQNFSAFPKLLASSLFHVRNFPKRKKTVSLWCKDKTSEPQPSWSTRERGRGIEFVSTSSHVITKDRNQSSLNSLRQV